MKSHGALYLVRATPIGEGSSCQTYGVQEHVTGNGPFTTTYTFGAGYAIYKSYWFQTATLPMGTTPTHRQRPDAGPFWSADTRGLVAAR